jgi:hypothetical protein
MHKLVHKLYPNVNYVRTINVYIRVYIHVYKSAKIHALMTLRIYQTILQFTAR